MDDRQAQESVRAIEQMWECELGSEREQWREALMPFDSVTVAGTILKLYESSSDRPSIPELVEAVDEMTRLKGESARADSVPDDPEPVEDMDRGAFEIEIPPWIKGWAVARYRHNDGRSFPEQRLGYDSHQINNPSAKTYIWPEQEKMPHEKAMAYIEEGAPLTVDEIFGMILS